MEKINLPANIKKKLVRNQILQGNAPNFSVFKTKIKNQCFNAADVSHGGFNFCDSIEGTKYWVNVEGGVKSYFNVVHPLDEFSIPIIKLMLKNQKLQGNPRSFDRLLNNKVSGGFNWDETVQGFKHWSNIIDKKSMKGIEISKGFETDFDKLPVEIQEKCIEYSIKTQRTRNEAIKVLRSSLVSGFTYSDTKEGGSFWGRILSKKEYDLFFKLYPKKSKQTISKTKVNIDPWEIKLNF